MPKTLTVAELIQFLQTQPQDLPVVYSIFSEFALMTENDIDIRRLSEPRADGWVHAKREDKPSREYLCFPGN